MYLDYSRPGLEEEFILGATIGVPYHTAKVLSCRGGVSSLRSIVYSRASKGSVTGRPWFDSSTWQPDALERAPRLRPGIAFRMAL